MHEEGGLHIALSAERLATLFGIPITNTIVTTWLVIVVMLLAAFFIGRNLKVMPGRFQNAIEMGYEYVYNFVKDTLGEEKYARRYFPLIITIFVFVLIANLLDFTPLIHPFTVETGGHEVSFFHAVNADLNTPLALAIVAFFVVEFSGVLTLGLLKYGSKFVNFKGGVMGFIIGLLEIVGNLARLVSLSFRLFGAIFAGEVLIMVITVFVPYVAPVPLMAFEVFIGLLQAAIFAILTLAYIKIAIEEPHSSSLGHAHDSEHHETQIPERRHQTA